MSREADYLVYATEQYRYAKGLSGRDVSRLFSRRGVFRYIIDMFDLFQIERDENMIEAIDEYLRSQGEPPPPTMAA